MPVSAALSAAVLFALFYGRLPTPALACLAVLLPLPVVRQAHRRGHHHRHGGLLSIDHYAQTSRLNRLNPDFKVWGTVLPLVFCVAADSLAVALVVCLSMLWLTVCRGGLGLSRYLSLMLVPGVFVLLSGLALLFDYSPAPLGLLDLPFPGGWLCVTPAAQREALLVMAKAAGGLSCLYAMSLSTPLYEIIDVLRRARVPAVVVELMMLIYRYIFVLMEVQRSMTIAAEARLGYHGLRSAYRTLGGLCSNLLALSFRRASVGFDAMEARCYDGELRFLTRRKPLHRREVLLAAGYLAALTALLIFEKTGGMAI